MNDLDKMFIIQWYGPFDTLEQLKNWEKANNTSYVFNMYILTGIEKSHRSNSHYCGITNQEFISHRLKYNHDKYPLIKRDLNIWAGRFADPAHVNKNNAELVESLIISFWQPELNDRKRKYLPADSVGIINKWYNKQQKSLQNRRFPAQNLTDVVIYDLDNKEIWTAEQLKRMKVQ